ncbi:MAG: hypothetical protein PHF05_06910 [Candidatus Izemoplasmatales bacterium]|nr:hypothetical protein [Candidatus Izemoplasmatales bacterium]
MNYTIVLKYEITTRYSVDESVSKFSKENTFFRSSICNWIVMYFENSIEEINISKNNTNLLN